MNGPARILVTDDDPLVREAYRSFFAHQPDFVICAEASNGAEGVAAYARERPDLVLMDLQMPVMSGLDAIRAICTTWPEACVVAMTTFSTSDYVVAALRAGASGYLLKDVGGPGLCAGLKQALAGEMPLSSAVRRELVSSLVEKPVPAPTAPAAVTVTPRERELLGWLAQGLTNAEIGAQMFVSEGSVKQYLLQVGRKLGVKARTGILIRSVQLGLVDPHALPPVRD
ncbi:response regulator [uncultured Friedmanniella sp.]|uniref:response regulator n=1 Tax=uncultured Friedmanniella sp. TaxID=335381 RepID=UPI0035CAE191